MFSDTPSIEFASNLFVGVPVILQCDDMPLIEFVKEEQAGFTTQISILIAALGRHLSREGQGVAVISYGRRREGWP